MYVLMRCIDNALIDQQGWRRDGEAETRSQHVTFLFDQALPEKADAHLSNIEQAAMQQRNRLTFLKHSNKRRIGRCMIFSSHLASFIAYSGSDTVLRHWGSATLTKDAHNLVAFQ